MMNTKQLIHTYQKIVLRLKMLEEIFQKIYKYSNMRMQRVIFTNFETKKIRKIMNIVKKF